MPFEQTVPVGHKQDVTGISISAALPIDRRTRDVERVHDWRAFYDENWQWIARVVRRFGGPAVDLEEAVQDVFVVLIEHLSEFEGRSELSTWVYRVCLNVASEHRRRAWRKGRLAAAWGAVAFWSDGPPSPARIAEAKDEVAIVQGALATLSEKKRDVFVLCELEEMSSDDAAAVLGIPAATVRTRLFHARREVEAAVVRMGDAT